MATLGFAAITENNTANSTAVFKIGLNSANTVYNGTFVDNSEPNNLVVAGAVTGVDKAGGGVVVLNGAGTYSGQTIVEGGVLLENASFAGSTATGTGANNSYVGTLSTAGLAAGELITGPGLHPGTLITAVGSGTVSISSAPIASPYTFTVPASSSLPASSNLLLNGGVLGLGNYGNFNPVSRYKRRLSSISRQRWIRGVHAGPHGEYRRFSNTVACHLRHRRLCANRERAHSRCFHGDQTQCCSRTPSAWLVGTNLSREAVVRARWTGLLSGAITDTGGGALNIIGNGIIQTNAANTYTGSTNVSGGTLTVDADTTDAGTGYTGTASASLASASVSVASGAGLHLITSLAAGSGGSTVNLLSASAVVSVTGSGVTPQIALDLNGNTQTISSFVLNGANLAPGYYGSSTFFADTGLTDASEMGAADAYFTGDGGFNVVAAAPEPTSLSIIGLGGIAMLAATASTLERKLVNLVAIALVSRARSN